MLVLTYHVPFQVTNGFPQNPSPIFKSIEFPIENRPGLENQSIERVISSLQSLDATSILPSTSSDAGDSHKRIELAKFLSDWHLIAFLQTTGLISPVRLRASWYSIHVLTGL